jgi:hypothetical protein
MQELLPSARWLPSSPIYRKGMEGDCCALLCGQGQLIVQYSCIDLRANVQVEDNGAEAYCPLSHFFRSSPRLAGAYIS